MNWLQRLFSKAQMTFSFIPDWVRATFRANTFSKLVEEGYRINSAVAACTTALAFSFPEPPLLAGNEVDGRFIADYTHPIMTLLRNPNPDMGDVELLQTAVTYASISGNFYLWKQRSASGKVVRAMVNSTTSCNCVIRKSKVPATSCPR